MKDEKNISEILLAAGFRETVSEYFKMRFNPNNGWFGVTKQHPDAEFVKGDKVVVVSLGGMLMRDLRKNEYENLRPLIESMSVRHISIKVRGTCLYETFSGELPSDKLIEDFILM